MEYAAEIMRPKPRVSGESTLNLWLSRGLPLPECLLSGAQCASSP